MKLFTAYTVFYRAAVEGATYLSSTSVRARSKEEAAQLVLDCSRLKPSAITGVMVAERMAA